MASEIIKQEIEKWMGLDVATELDKTTESIEEPTVAVKDATEEVEEYSEALKNAKKNITDLSDELTAYMETLEFENEKLERQKTLNEKLYDIEKKRVALAEAQSKKILVFRAGQGFVEASDMQAVQDAQEDLIAAQSEYKETVSQYEYEDFKSFVDELSEGVDDGTIFENWVTFFDKFGSLMDTQYASFLTQAKDFIAEYNRLLALEGSDEAFEIIKKFVAENNLLQGDVNRWGSELSLGGVLDEWQALSDAQRQEIVAGAPVRGGGGSPTSSDTIDNGSSGSDNNSNSSSFWSDFFKAFKTGAAFANGTTSASGGLSLVGEQGAEMRVLSKGDGIIPSNITKNLMAIGSNPSSLVKSNNQTNNNNTTYQIGTVQMNGVQDVDGFVNELVKIATPSRM